MTAIGEIMASIFASGTAYAAPTLALVLSIACLSAPVAAAESADLVLHIDNLRNSKGNLLICVTQNAKQFPDCSKDIKAQRLVLPTSSVSNVPVTVSLPAPGQYAVSLVHDENGNGKLDTLLMVPREGYGFSRNPRISFGPPSFAKASFSFDGEAIEKRIQVKYSF